MKSNLSFYTHQNFKSYLIEFRFKTSIILPEFSSYLKNNPYLRTT